MTKYIKINNELYPIVFNLWAMTMIEEKLKINFAEVLQAIGGGNSLKTKLEIANLGFAAGHRAEKKEWEPKEWEDMAEFLNDDGDLLEQIEHVYLFQVFGKRLEEVIEKSDKVVAELKKAIQKEKDKAVKISLEETRQTMENSSTMAKNVLARVRATTDSLPSPNSEK